MTTYDFYRAEMPMKDNALADLLEFAKKTSHSMNLETFSKVLSEACVPDVKTKKTMEYNLRQKTLVFPFNESESNES